MSRCPGVHQVQVHQVSVVQMLNNVVQRINRYPLDKYNRNLLIEGRCYSPFEQPGPVFYLVIRELM